MCHDKFGTIRINGPPATGGALGPPLGLDFKLPKNGFSEAPQTSQVPRMVLGAILVKKIFGHMTPLGPPDSYKKGVMAKKHRILRFLLVFRSYFQ